MNELRERPSNQVEDEIQITFTFTDGSTYTQGVYLRNADWVEGLMKWFRDEKSPNVWTWNYSVVSKIMLIDKRKVMTIEVDGYIELERTSYKWHEKLKDKLLTKLVFLKIK